MIINWSLLKMKKTYLLLFNIFSQKMKRHANTSANTDSSSNRDDKRLFVPRLPDGLIEEIQFLDQYDNNYEMDSNRLTSFNNSLSSNEDANRSMEIALLASQHSNPTTTDLVTTLPEPKERATKEITSFPKPPTQSMLKSIDNRSIKNIIDVNVTNDMKQSGVRGFVTAIVTAILNKEGFDLIPVIEDIAYRVIKVMLRRLSIDCGVTGYVQFVTIENDIVVDIYLNRSKHKIYNRIKMLDFEPTIDVFRFLQYAIYYNRFNICFVKNGKILWFELVDGSYDIKTLNKTELYNVCRNPNTVVFNYDVIPGLDTIKIGETIVALNGRVLAKSNIRWFVANVLLKDGNNSVVAFITEFNKFISRLYKNINPNINLESIDDYDSHFSTFYNRNTINTSIISFLNEHEIVNVNIPYHSLFEKFCLFAAVDTDYDWYLVTHNKKVVKLFVKIPNPNFEQGNNHDVTIEIVNTIVMGLKPTIIIYFCEDNHIKFGKLYNELDDNPMSSVSSVASIDYNYPLLLNLTTKKILVYEPFININSLRAFIKITAKMVGTKFNPDEINAYAYSILGNMFDGETMPSMNKMVNVNSLNAFAAKLASLKQQFNTTGLSTEAKYLTMYAHYSRGVINANWMFIEKTNTRGVLLYSYVDDKSRLNINILLNIFADIEGVVSYINSQKNSPLLIFYIDTINHTISIGSAIDNQDQIPQRITNQYKFDNLHFKIQNTYQIDNSAYEFMYMYFYMKGLDTEKVVNETIIMIGVFKQNPSPDDIYTDEVACKQFEVDPYLIKDFMNHLTDEQVKMISQKHVHACLIYTMYLPGDWLILINNMHGLQVAKIINSPIFIKFDKISNFKDWIITNNPIVIYLKNPTDIDHLKLYNF